MNAARACAVTFLLTCAPLTIGAGPPAAKPVAAKPGEPPAVEIVGLAEADLAALAAAKLDAAEWPKVARLVVEGKSDEETAKKPPVAGAWAVTGEALRFEPQFPLVPGVKYRVFCDLRDVPRSNRKGDAFSVAVFIPKPPPGPRVSVLHVYPSANRLPENTLRFYVHFSGQVTRGDIYSRFKLVRDDGKQVLRPFLEIDEELWSADGLRLTILCDPGRVKRGLSPREQIGPILEEGRSYSLAIDANWPDADGRPLLAGYKKSFSVFAPDDEPVSPDDWKLVAPRAGSDSPLSLRLPKPLDHALLNRMLWVTDATGQRVEGTLAVGGGERVVTFTPAKPWVRGNYKLMIDALLEDVCGNRVGESFEIDVFRPIPLRPAAKLAERAFAVK